jgi:purine-nucleoside phosphorylase
VPTPHIAAQTGDFAEAILLPGDPLRAQFIAETYFSDVKQVNAVRNMLGFTGVYKDMPISVMGTGMGIPTASIYVSELIDEYAVKRLVRVGSCGGVSSDVGVRDVIIASGASTDSSVNRTRYAGWDYAAIADFDLAQTAAGAARTAGLNVKVGNVHSADLFYNPNPEAIDVMDRMGVLAVEMEAAGIYGAAAERRARALTILTVSDHVRTGESTTSDERERGFGQMVEIALEGLLIDSRTSD